MKALSIKPPWVELIVSGQKTIETRTWPTKHRGPILLCSSKSLDEGAARIYSYGAPHLIPLPRGHALATAQLVGCRAMIKEDRDAALCPYFPGLFAWILADIRPIEPFPVRGRLGLFDVPLDGKRLEWKR